MAWHDQPKIRDHPDVDAYLADLDDWQRDLCAQVRERLKQDPDVVEGIAWGVPCYFRNGPLAYTSAARAHVTLGFFRGYELGLEGTGKSPVGKIVVKKGSAAPYGFDDLVTAATRLDDEGD